MRLGLKALSEEAGSLEHLRSPSHPLTVNVGWGSPSARLIEDLGGARMVLTLFPSLAFPLVTA